MVECKEDEPVRQAIPETQVLLLKLGSLKVGSQYAAQLRDVAKHFMLRRVCREFRLRVYPSDAATCTVSALPRRKDRLEV